MKLKFEKWYINQNYHHEANLLFSEATLCYKIGAYRAAIIMSYLGMQTVIRKRVLLITETPARIEEGSWKKRQKNIRNDQEWDKEVFDLANMGIDRNPFLITDDIRKQYEYWRTIRNTCAHSKSGLIDSAHVESLWLFIESNLNKFIVNGGKNYIISEIEKNLDPNYTLPGTPISPLVDSILDFVHGEDLIDFIQELLVAINGEITINGDVLGSDAENNELWIEIYKHKRPELREALKTLVKQELKYTRFFISCFPDLIEVFNEDRATIRSIWKLKYWDWNIPWYVERWKLFMYLLKNGYIESAEELEYLKLVIDKIGKFPPPEYIEMLKTKKFFEIVDLRLFDEQHFGQDSFNYCNLRVYDFIKIIQINGLNDNNVRLINGELRLMSYGTFVDEMKNFFDKNQDFRKQFISIAEANQLELADVLQQ